MNKVASERQSSTARLSRKAVGNQLTIPIVRLLTRTSITPNTLTWLGFFISAGAAALVITGHPFVAGFVVLVGGFFDLLDGALARYINKTTRFGTVLDSVLDRFSDAIVLIGILVLYTFGRSLGGIIITSAALILSLVVSYIRARAESVGLECKVGLFTRPERVIVLALGLILSQFAYALFTALMIIAVFSFITVVQRLHHVQKQAEIDNKQ
ncbi:MAG: CDP-alcohol phosphatidyltransferase family protein [Chloroflexi bacterium]|nr:CDP-alcohol phosphatidyltransferase family protein [Chloroflexota bacterium]